MYRLDLKLDSARVVRRTYNKIALTTFLMTFVKTDIDLNKVIHGLNQLFNEGATECEFSLNTGNILVYQPMTDNELIASVLNTVMGLEDYS